MKEFTLVDDLDHPVAVVFSSPQNATSVAVLSHGFGSNKDTTLFVDLQSTLNKCGIAVLRYDYFGHGPEYVTGGGFQVRRDITLTKAVASLRRVVRYCHDEGFLRVALVGSSFGGLLSLVVASQTPNLSALCLRSPVTDPLELWQKRVNDVDLRGWKERGVFQFTGLGELLELNYEFWEDINRYHVLDDAQKIRCPSFVVHGDSDTTVAISHSLALAKILGIDVRVIAGADHRYTSPLHYEEMRAAVAEFLVTQLNNSPRAIPCPEPEKSLV